MYEDFYGLRERPFELTPNPRFLCRMPAHREALSNLEYGISTGRGITLLVGEAGTGKTTLLRAALQGLSGTDTLCVTMTNPTLTRAEFVQFLAHGFSLNGGAGASKSLLLREFEELLRRRHARGARTVLVIDEAQSLPYELLEEIRLLANIETNEEKLLPLVLAGQPELAERLNEPSLRQLKQRIALRCTLAPLDLQQTATYIATRIRTAGGDSAQLFTWEAVRTVHRYARGIPRTISVICDNALLSGFAVEARPVPARVVREVCADFDLEAAADAAPAVPADGAAPADGATATPAAAAAEPAEPVAEPELSRGASRRRFFLF